MLDGKTMTTNSEMKLGEFTVHKTEGNARRATLMTAHGPVQTPVFMAVGTKATVKAVSYTHLTLPTKA